MRVDGGRWAAARPAEKNPMNAPQRKPATGLAAPSMTSGAASGATTGAANPGNADGQQDAQTRRIFDQLDANHDGTLSFDEFSRATFRAR